VRAISVLYYRNSRRYGCDVDRRPVALPSLPDLRNGQVSRSIWYRFTPTTTGSYGISACASDGTASTADDTVMAIYTSSTSACGGVFTQVPSASMMMDAFRQTPCNQHQQLT